LTGVPYGIEINITLLMDENVSHANHNIPRHIWQFCPGLRRYSPRGLTNDFKAANNRILALNILQKFLLGFSANKRKDESCSLQDVQQTFFISLHE